MKIQLKHKIKKFIGMIIPKFFFYTDGICIKWMGSEHLILEKYNGKY